MFRITIASLVLAATLLINGACAGQTPAEQKELEQLGADRKKLVELTGQGKYDKAAEIGRKMVEVTKRIFGKEHPYYATNLFILADVYKSKGSYDRAEPLYLAAKEIKEKVSGKEHPDYGLSLDRLASMYRSMRSYDRAELLYLEAIEIREKVHGKEHPRYVNSLGNLALMYEEIRSDAQAEALYLEAIEITEKIFGKENEDYLSCLGHLARLYTSMGAYVRAEPLHIETIKIKKRMLGKEHPGCVSSLEGLAVLYIAMKKYDLAEPLYLEAVNIEKKVFGKEDPRYASSLGGLAALYGAMGKYDRAEPLYLEAKKVFEKALGKKHHLHLVTLNALAELYKSMNSYQRAERLYVEIKKIKEEVIGKEHPKYAATLDRLAELHEAMGGYEQAESLYLESNKIKEKAFGSQHPIYASNLRKLADLYNQMGLYDRAEPLYLEAKEIAEKVFGKEHPDYALNLVSLGILHQNKGLYAQAEPLFLEAMKIQENTLGKEHPNYAATLTNLSILYDSLGARQRVLPLLLESHKITEKVFGKEHPSYAGSLANLAICYHNAGFHDRAEQMHLDAQTIQEKVLGKEHPSYALNLNNLANLYQNMGSYDRAELLYLEVKEIRKKVLGELHPHYAASLNNLGYFFSSIGSYDRAEPLYLEAKELRKKLLGEWHPDYFDSLNYLTILYLATKQDRQAIRFAELTQRSVRGHLIGILPGLSNKQRKWYLTNSIDKTTGTALSVGYHTRSDHNNATLSAGWLVNTKGMIQETEAEAALLSHPDATGLVQQLRSVRRQLAELTLSIATDPTQEKRVRFEDLESQQNKINQKLVPYRLNDVEKPWVDMGDVRENLPLSTAMVNIAKFKLQDPSKLKKDAKSDNKDKKEEQAKPIYVAWIIPASGEGDVRLVPLGNAATIEPKIKALREQLTASALNQIRDEGEEKLEQQFIKLSKDLSASVFAPLEEHLADFEEIIVSPDGELWSIPWELLRSSDDKYLLEKYRIRYLTSGRELATKPRTHSGISQPVVMADPDYNLSPNKIDAVDKINKQSLRSAATATFNRLPSSRSEANSIKSPLEGYTKTDAKLLLGPEAQESAFKQLHRPQSLVISTHGYFEKQDTENTNPQTFVNPLLRCGLALAGANNRKQAAAAGKEDGILTGLEIVGTDLRGTELVVLSACETGLGDITSGEGVAGLRQAFQLAGAQSVVSSLWQVEDGETARLMKLFFDNLAAGKSKSESLRAAQLSRIKARRARHGAAHPFFWAAFTLTGQD